MGSSPRGVLVLESITLLVAVGCSGASSSSSSPHSLCYFYTGLSEPSPGLPQFSIVGYVDDQPFVKYDSVTRRYVPLVSWMEEVGKEDPQYWERNTQMAQSTESVFTENLGTLRERFNQQNSTGLHTLQWMYDCEVGPDWQPLRGHYQFAYDGEDFLAFDRETVRWTAAVPQAEISRQKLDRRQDISQGRKDYLEGTCVEWLRRYLAYGNETLLRTEAPVTRVARKKGYDGQETISCQLYGFYPKEIEVTWMKDGEDQKLETMTGGVVPNLDGTYHTWLSIDVDPKEKGRYRCRVGHDSLPEPLDLAWEDPGGSSSSSSPHSLRYFHTALSEPGQGLPQFSIVGYVDDQPFVKYESDGRKMLPQVPWMEEFGKEDPQYWEGQSQRAQGAEPAFRGNLGTLRERFNQQNSTGLHILQFMVGCEVGPDGRLRGGHYQFAYDGEDFLAFDRETVRWTAAVPQAEISRQKLDRQQDISQRVKDYLEGECVEWLRRYLGYGNETLLRTERPTWRVACKKGYDGQETLFCQLCGFYPKEIEVTWMKDGEDQKPHTWTGGVVPNSDGTYNTLVSIDVDPQEKGRYRCRVEHDSLPEPLNLAWEEPASSLGLILSIVGSILLAVSILGVVIAFRTSNLGRIPGIIPGLTLLVVALLVGFVAFRRKREEKGYEAASRKQLKSYEAASTSNLGPIVDIVGALLAALLLVGLGINIYL